MGNFPPIYFINLARRTDRREFFEGQCARLGLSPQRIEAVTPATLDHADIARFCNPASPRFLRQNELACLRSHVETWKAMRNAGHGFAVIFEDDALLSDSLPGFLRQIEAASLYGYDLIRLEDAGRIRMYPATQATGSGIALHEFRSTLRGSSGYVLSADAAGRLLASHDLGTRQIDLALYDQFRKPGSMLHRAIVSPALCVQFASRDGSRQNVGLGKSDIDPPVAERSADFRHIYRGRHPIRYGLRKFASQTVGGVVNMVDHIVQLWRGLRRASVNFKGDSPFTNAP